MASRSRPNHLLPGAATLREARRVFGEQAEAPADPESEVNERKVKTRFARPSQEEIEKIADRLVRRRARSSKE